jgi:hypothetical protein
VHQRQVGAERPTQQPPVRQGRVLVELGQLDRGRDVEPLPHTLVERALAGAGRRRGASGVEPQHRHAGESGQPVGRLPDHVAVHEATVGRQRVQGHQRRDRVAVDRHRQLAHQAQAVRGVQRQPGTPGGQHRAGPDLLRPAVRREMVLGHG